VAEPLLGALMPVGTEEGGELQFDQLLQALACQLRDQFPGAMPSSSEARSAAAQWVLGMVRLVEVVLKPGKRACPPLATPDVVPIA